MELRFLLDGMLGKLARWLRILGHDAMYRSELTDSELLKIASEESRVLITRDRDLHRRALLKNIESHFLENTDLAGWLEPLRQRYGINLNLRTTKPRCSLCNRPLDAASRDIVLSTVPARVQERRSKFWYCPDCRKTYWQGTHWENMRDFLQSLCKDWGA